MFCSHNEMAYGQCIFKCLISLLFSVKAIFSPVCVFMWVIRLQFWVKYLSQWLHWYGFYTVCVLMWTIRLQFWVKYLSQWLHLYGFCPVCVLRCIITSQFCLINISHLLHWFGFSPVCFQMYYKITILSDKLITFTALIWFLPSVCSQSQMYCKITIPSDKRITLTALKWFITRECSQMFSKIILLWELVIITAALNGFFPLWFLKWLIRLDRGNGHLNHHLKKSSGRKYCDSFIIT